MIEQDNSTYSCFSIIRSEIDTQNFPNSTNKKVELKFFIKFKLYFSIFQCTNFSYSKHLQSSSQRSLLISWEMSEEVSVSMGGQANKVDAPKTQWKALKGKIVPCRQVTQSSTFTPRPPFSGFFAAYVTGL